MAVTRGSVALVLGAWLVGAGGAANAQPTDTVAAADQLFDEAKALFEKGDYAAACPRFEASRKLDPALGTLLFLATCFEKTNRLASAWSRYRELEALAAKAGDTQRAAIARERIAAIEPALARLKILAPPTAIAGIVINRDDTPLDPTMFGAGIYVDSGDHVIVASAPGRKSFTTRITIQDRESKEVQIPDLERIPDTKPPGIKPSNDGTDGGRSRRIVGLAVAGGGAAVVAVGLGFGFSARSLYRSAFDDGLCFEDTKRCIGPGQARTDRARDRALISNVLSGVGLAAVGAGLIVYFTAPRPAAVEVAPSITPSGDGGGVTIRGYW